MKLAIYSIFIVYGVAAISDVYPGNYYMSAMTDTVRKIAGHKKIHIPDFKVHHEQFGEVWINVDIDYFDSELTGLFEVAMHDNCSPVVREEKIIKFNCTQRFENLKFYYSGKVSIGNLIENEHINFRIDFAPFLATTCFKGDVEQGFLKIDDFAYVKNVPIIHRMYGLDNHTKDFVKVITEGIIPRSVKIFLSALYSTYIDTYRNIVEKTPIQPTMY